MLQFTGSLAQAFILPIGVLYAVIPEGLMTDEIMLVKHDTRLCSNPLSGARRYFIAALSLATCIWMLYVSLYKTVYYQRREEVMVSRHVNQDLCREQLESPEINVNTLDVNEWTQWMNKFDIDVPGLLNASK